MRDHRKVFGNGKSEDSKFDRQRAERINLKTFSYGVPKFDQGKNPPFPGTCLKCVFNEGTHTCAGSI